MNVKTQKFQSLYALVCKPSARRNHRTTLPQSRPLGVTAPSEREPGMGCAIHRTARKPQRCGRFSSPLRNSECLTALNHRTTLPQSRPLGVTAPSEREPGLAGAIHRTCSGAQRRDWKVAIWVVASSRALSQKALSVRSIPATRAVASAVATVVVCSSFLYTGTKSGPCCRYWA